MLFLSSKENYCSRKLLTTSMHFQAVNVCSYAVRGSCVVRVGHSHFSDYLHIPDTDNRELHIQYLQLKNIQIEKVFLPKSNNVSNSPPHSPGLPERWGLVGSCQSSSPSLLWTQILAGHTSTRGVESAHHHTDDFSAANRAAPGPYLCSYSTVYIYFM